MKRFLIASAVFSLLLLVCGHAFAAQASSTSTTEIDGMLSIATDPVSGLDTALGLGVGIGFDLSDSLKPSTGKLYGRVDINYFDWGGDWGWSYTRVPIFFGGRYYVPTSGSGVNVFVEAGLELSYDKKEVPYPYPPFFFGYKVSQSEFHLGITPGAGIEVPISPSGLFIGGDARWHLIDDDYFTLSLVLGTKF